MPLPHHPAYYTHAADIGAWYFAPVDRKPPVRQVKVTAIIDIAEDGSLSGVEIIDLPETGEQAA